MDEKYHKQAKLLLEILPFVIKEDCFALTGGTALNFFMLDFPRFAVKIDLTYAPLDCREISLKNIDTALANIKKNIEKVRSDLKVIYQGKNLSIHAKAGDSIMIEANARGAMHSIVYKDLAMAVEHEFKMSVLDMPMLSLADLYGSKIVAALDRQHPQSLFDIKVLLANSGLTENIRKAFLLSLISHNQPAYKILSPDFQKIDIVYEKEFVGITSERIALEDLLKTRVNLLEQIHATLTHNKKEFLISFKQGEPNWSLLGIAGVEMLPIVQWKLKNIQMMNKERKYFMLDKLEQSFNFVPEKY